MSNAFKPGIEHVLLLSTAHLSPQTAAILNTVAKIGEEGLTPEQKEAYDVFPAFGSWEYGWWVWVEGDPISKETRKHFPELGPIMHYAKGAGCTWIRFDADIPWVEMFATYEW